ncbi:DNA gyrase inhibitor YacG [Sphingomonas sp. Leaf231]|uniref:DNA gyrase inhibitor YacG n=1 Tax=Sphingomonas sp. Leaf231 TaxID=1736301 RepID=UPI0009EC716E|nr:DNA gyrase inhibitor YacG [Sphingomonas sp. Leaf231]
MTKSRCPICAAPATPTHTPFCSRGCKDRDLLRWLSDGYRLPGATIDTESLDSHADTD